MTGRQFDRCLFSNLRSDPQIAFNVLGHKILTLSLKSLLLFYLEPNPNETQRPRVDRDSAEYIIEGKPSMRAQTMTSVLVTLLF